MSNTSANFNNDVAVAQRIAAQRNAEQGTRKPAEVHIIGEILGGSGFGEGRSIACKWAMEVGEHWTLIEGDIGGQTQTDTPESGTDVLVWNHPIDVHFSASALKGWPRMIFQCWRLDEHGRLEVEGYGFIHIPSSPGTHEISCALWKPVGTEAQEFSAFFIGGSTSLKSTAVLSSAATERHRLVTTSSGHVHVRVNVLLRNLHIYNVEA